MKKQWITFDLDGTLMQNPFGKWVFPEINETVSRWAKASIDVTSELVTEHNRRMKLERYVEAYDWDEMLEAYLEHLNIARKLNIEEIVINHCVSPKIHLLEEGILTVLGELRTRGYLVAAVTNGFFKYQYPVMEKLGLAEYFDVIVTPERARTGKPDPAILRTLEGNVIAHVGDRLDHDVQLANLYGCQSVLVYRNLPEELQALQPWQRAAHQTMHQICRAKWQEEGSVDLTESLPDVCKPKVVIGSIKELLSVSLTPDVSA
ncbi:HAD family hydrolase [Brevibacillus borstelensis]|uniref:HAD family hydrolase n=1 Tax=Brevibacillus borstelensis TaxID=45462 RepID=UPI0030C03682